MKQKILLLHGAIGSSSQLIPLVELLEKNYDVHTLNFSGHGGKSFNSKFSIEQFAQEVITFLDEKAIQQINVFGYSMGGYVALYIAKYYHNRLIKIITLGTKFKWTPEIAFKEIKMLNPEKIEDKIPAFADVLAKRHSPIDWKKLLIKTSEMMLEMGEQNPILIEDYQTIINEVKIGLADADEMVTTDETQEVVKVLRNVSFYTLKNSKHPIEKANLEQLVTEIKEFIN